MKENNTTELEKKVEGKALTAAEKATALVIVDEAGLSEAGAFLVGLKTLAGEVIDTFKDAKAAAAKAHKAVCAAEKKHLEPLTKAEGVVKAKMADYIETREAALRKAQEDALVSMAAAVEEAGDSAMADAIVGQTVTVAKAEVEGMSYRKAYDFTITDPNAVPREYLMLDEKKVGAVVRAMGKAANIPGITVVEKTVISARKGVS